MSDPLTDSAPQVEDGGPSVEGQAPVDVPEVEAGSGSSEDTIPAERFNGLMASFNKEKEASSAKDAELAELREQLAAAQTQLETSPTPEENPVTNAPDPSTDDLKNQVAQLTELVGQLVAGSHEDRTNKVREQVLAEYSDIAPFHDLLVADTEEDLRSVAEDVRSRLGQLTGTPAAPVVEDSSGDAGAPVNPDQGVTAPATSGGPPVSSNPTSNDKVKEAIASGDFAAWAAARHGDGASDDSLMLEGSA